MGRTRSWSYGRSLACWTNWGLLGLHLLKGKEIKHVWASLYYPDCLLHTVRVLLTNTSWAVSSWSLHSKFFSLIQRQNLDEAHLPVLGGFFSHHVPISDSFQHCHLYHLVHAHIPCDAHSTSAICPSFSNSATPISFTGPAPAFFCSSPSKQTFPSWNS